MTARETKDAVRFGRGTRWGQYLASLSLARTALERTVGYALDLDDHDSERALALVERLERRAWERFEKEKRK